MSFNWMISSPLGIIVSFPRLMATMWKGMLRVPNSNKGVFKIWAVSRILAPIRIKAPPLNSHHWRIQLILMASTMSLAASISG